MIKFAPCSQPGTQPPHNFETSVSPEARILALNWQNAVENKPLFCTKNRADEVDYH